MLLLPGDAIGVVGDFDPDVGGDTKDSYLAVLESDGDLDPTFGGGDGKVTVAARHDRSRAVLRRRGLFGGKVLVAGDGGFEQSARLRAAPVDARDVPRRLRDRQHAGVVGRRRG